MNENQNLDQILQHFSIDALNPMQQSMLEHFKHSSDIMLLSPTGSGKTLAYLLPLLKLIDKESTHVQALILVPSRELALQIESVFKQMKTGLKVNCCYGGHDFKVEKNNLSSPPSVLIGTPGRIADHIGKGTFNTTALHTLIFDEFDKSLEFGFSKEMEYIVQHLPNVKSKILISATQSIDIPRYIKISEVRELNFLDKDSTSNTRLSVKLVLSEDVDKLEAFLKLLCSLDSNAPTIVFCNHREVVERISDHLNRKNIENACFHGKLDQKERERVLVKFTNGSVNVLITTDLASRGLDIREVKNIIHYQQPHSEEVFIHRNGRTARMHASGSAFMILTQKEERPAYLAESTEVLELSDKYSLPSPPLWVTLFISKGKKDAINKTDIVGFLSKVGKLNRDELGFVDVKDFFAYAAVKREKADKVLKLAKDQKIKNRAVKINFAE